MPLVAGVSLKPATSMCVGGQQQLYATIQPSDAGNKNVTWASSDSAVAAVSDSGLVTGVSLGSADITVTTQDGNWTAKCAVTVAPMTFASVVAGNLYSLAIDAYGSLWAWGLNGSGQLGLGDYWDRNAPVQVGTANDWVAVSANTSWIPSPNGERRYPPLHTAAIKSDGSLWTWGSTYNTQLGYEVYIGGGMYASAITTPRQMDTANDWKAVSVGYGCTLAIKNDGSLWGWGELGLGQNYDGIIKVPTRVGADNDWVAVCRRTAIKADGSLWALGGNGPTRVGADNDWVYVSQSSYNSPNIHQMALKTDGSLWAWGRNSGGQLGDGTGDFLGDNPSAHKDFPVRVGTANNWKAVSAGSGYTLAIETDGSLWAWGTGYFDLITYGNGTRNYWYVPICVSTADDWVAVEASGTHALAIKADGSLWAWGDNDFGQLGLGDTTDRKAPTRVAGPK
ncbi:MAG: Ig-like domain-containing protein [Holophagales bacterium]|nr:Ig-like domain-containing protein [Holophagales bacterium]